jgi:mannose-1-phosphate guanylyltransferase
MRAILLAAGFGTRLRPITNNIPKCLVSINRRPLLDIWLSNLANAGIGPFIINTHHLSDQVSAHIRKSPFSGMAVLVYEPNLLGTAGTLIHNAEFFCGEDGMLIHADNYCNVDFKDFMQSHTQRPAGCEMTMMTFRTNAPSSCGIVELNDQKVVVGFHEKVPSPPGNLANGAIYILSKKLISEILLTNKNAFDFSTEILPTLIGKIFTYEVTGVFVDIGTPEMYEFANHLDKTWNQD